MPEMTEPLPIAVAMSGGVDSSTVAALLVRQGHRIVGMTMQLWNQRRLPGLSSEAAVGRCCSLDDVYDARRVAEQLGVPYYVVNFERQFEDQVVKPFVAEYLAGRTPVPCTLCNNYIKFDRFLEMADAAGARQIATGHYARIRHNPESGRYELLRGVDHAKDQTYFLFGLTQSQLARTLFPLGDLTKPEVRELASSMDLSVAVKADSQEICFVPNGDYAAFMNAYLEETGVDRARTEGEIVSEDGRVLGHHEGVHRFTVGQRKGLGIAAAEPLYVIATDPQTQRVVVGSNQDLLRGRCFVKEVNWISIASPAGQIRAQVKIRNKHVPADANVETVGDGARVEVTFDEAQRAVTPGQGAVFYDGDVVLGGGWIE
jgi:tRNA-uridine 2-sulfurtransferase